MRRSVLFSRVFSVVILTIMMTALFTAFIYNFISRSVFTKIKENELLPRAHALGSMLTNYDRQLLDTPGGQTVLRAMVNANQEGETLLGAFVVITDSMGQVVLSSDTLRQDYLATIPETAQTVMHQGELRTHQIPMLRNSSMVGVGVPIESDGEQMGTVFMLVPLYEATIAMGSLNGALVTSLIFSLPMVAVMIYWVVGLLVQPLKQMRDVALGMVGGNFEARADTSQRGEVGQLARSLNYLSQELSRTIAALTLEKNRLQQTLDGLHEGIVAVDRLGHVTHHNPAIAHMFHALLPSDDPSDERIRLIPDAQIWQDFDRVVGSGSEITRSVPVGDRLVQIRISQLMGEDNQPAGAVGLFTDVTESERLERTRRDYVANVSHEMRTPLTAMRALLEPLSEGMVTEEAARQRYYSIMLRETMRLTRLIEDLMELSRLQSGQLAMPMQPVSLVQTVEELSDKYRSMAEDHDLSFRVALDPECPCVLANPDRLEQVLVILLDNAIKYTPEGGDVRISAKWDKRKVTVSISDSGIGIDPKDQPYVFDRFYKVDKSHSGLGSGLGLSIAKELISLMGESIWVTSDVGKGSAFSFTLRRA